MGSCGGKSRLLYIRHENMFKYERYCREETPIILCVRHGNMIKICIRLRGHNSAIMTRSKFRCSVYQNCVASFKSLHQILWEELRRQSQYWKVWRIRVKLNAHPYFVAGAYKMLKTNKKKTNIFTVKEY